MNSVDLKAAIRTKFKSISRFSALSRIPYHTVNDAFRKQNALLLKRVEKAYNDTQDKKTFDEIEPETIRKVQSALKGKDVGKWCSEQGIPHFWLQSFLRGEKRFKTRIRVKRLLEALKIE